MIRKTIIMAALILAAVITYVLDLFYELGIEKVYLTFIALAIIFLSLNIFTVELVARRIKDPKAKYSFRKAISIISIVLMILSLAIVWIEDSTALVLSYGLIGAGVAIALQDILRNIAGGLTIFVTGVYRVGDRVEIGERTGDVIDIGIMYTTLMEIRQWVEGDQATGRLISITNGTIITGSVTNFTRDHRYIWDELMIPITYQSNWRKASSLLKDILVSQTEEFYEGAQRDIERIGEKYYLPSQDVLPNVYVVPTDNWLSMHLRYTVPVRERRVIRDRINRLLIEMLEKNPDIEVASENMEISRFPVIRHEGWGPGEKN